jgi:polar amino acid transport system substrate-binding protein
MPSSRPAWRGIAARACRRLAGLALLAAATATCAAPEDVAPTGVLRATFLGSNPVQGQVNAQTGEITGVVADLVRALAARLGVKYEIHPAANAADIVARLKAGQSDIGFFAYDAERGKEVDFSQSYALMHSSLLVRADSPIQTSAEADRAGQTVAAVRGQTQYPALNAMVKQARMLALEKKPGQAELEALLDSRQIDAYGANRHDTVQVAAASGGKLRALPDSFLIVEQAIVTPKGQPRRIAELDSFIVEARTNGLVQQVLERTRIVGLTVATGSTR